MLSIIQSMDEGVLLFLQEMVRCPVLNWLMVPITILGNAGVVWIALSLLMLCFRHTRRAGVLALCSLLLCFLCNNVILKNLVARPRPYTIAEGLIPIIAPPSDASFPSGHACASFAAACSWRRGLKERKGSRWIYRAGLALAVLIALSRLYVGVHYPTDVIVGSLIGGFGSLLVWKLLSPVYDRLGQQNRFFV